MAGNVRAKLYCVVLWTLAGGHAYGADDGIDDVAFGPLAPLDVPALFPGLNSSRVPAKPTPMEALLAKVPAPAGGETDLDFIRSIYGSKAPTEDRNGDGKIDVWREFYPSGAIKAYKSSSFGNGRPDLIVHYAEDGTVTGRDVDKDGNGVIDVEVRYLDLPEGRVEQVSERDPGFKSFNRWSRMWRGQSGYMKQKIEVDSNGDGKINRVSERDIDPNAWSNHGDGAGCAPGYEGPLGAEGIEQVARELAARIKVDSSCNGFSFTNGGTRFTETSLRDRIASVLRRGIGCLRGSASGSPRTPGGRRIVESALANVFVGGRELEIKCRPPGSIRSCPGQGTQGEFCARAATFADTDNFPSISLVGNCGRPEAALDRVIFHEFLHLGGSCNHQFIHGYTSVEQTEVVETCSQCCTGTWRTDMPAAVARRQQYCNLCNDRPSDPVEHNLRYGVLASLAGDHGIAMDELEKVVAAEPGNVEAWSHLLNQYYRQYEAAADDLRNVRANLARRTDLSAEQKAATIRQYESRRSAYVYRLSYAYRRLAHLGKNPADRSGRATVDASSLPPVGPLGSLVRMIIQDEMNRDAPAGVGGLSADFSRRLGNYRYWGAQFNIARSRCSDFNPSSEAGASPREERARTCYAQLRQAIRGMKSNTDWLRRERRRLAESGNLSAAGALTEDDVEDWANVSDRMFARLTCMENGTAPSDCSVPPRRGAPPAQASAPAGAAATGPPVDCPPPPSAAF